LSAIRRYTQLGVGFRLAVKDLEIRGAGNILGAQQSGHINAIGFDLYCQLLKETVSSLNGKKEVNFIPSVDISLDFLEFGICSNSDKINAYLPIEYIDSEILRVEFYRRLSSVSSVREIEDLKREIIDRFGKKPKESENFIAIMKIKLKVGLAGYHSISVSNEHLFIEGGKKNIFMINGKIPRLYEKSPLNKFAEVKRIVEKI
jgi:transcription-repair coupling factor (superfamily II helicase)